SRKKTRERNDSPGSPLNKNEVLKPQAFEKLVGIKTSTKFRAPFSVHKADSENRHRNENRHRKQT
ncbi:hypothetical protein, partial [Allobaculum mucilyticum]|uniref:hypothetical protein n=1 Tax=Allobaculum mucilyticum TaxID=2834459 RepID=UPI001E5129A0